jgi:hypothetical protein
VILIFLVLLPVNSSRTIESRRWREPYKRASWPVARAWFAERTADVPE